MRAWAQTTRGPPKEVLSLRSDLPVPSKLGPDEVLIKVSHVSLNAGMLIFIMMLPHFNSKPWIPEMGFSGTIVGLGAENRTEFKIGDQVNGARTLSGIFKYSGVLAEYIVSPANLVMARPAKLSLAEAACAANVGSAAIQQVNLANLKKGDKVLITGSSGSMGTMLVQVAKAIVGDTGFVVATCSERTVELVKRLGADEVIDYTVHSPLSSYLVENHSREPFNAIFDIAGADETLYPKCPSYLSSNGHFILVGGMPAMKNPSWRTMLRWGFWVKTMEYRPVWLGGVPRKLQMPSGIATGHDMKRIGQMIEADQVKIIIDSVWEMEDALKGYERLQSQRSRGLIVIKVEAE